MFVYFNQHVTYATKLYASILFFCISDERTIGVLFVSHQKHLWTANTFSASKIIVFKL